MLVTTERSGSDMISDLKERGVGNPTAGGWLTKRPLGCTVPLDVKADRVCIAVILGRLYRWDDSGGGSSHPLGTIATWLYVSYNSREAG